MLGTIRTSQRCYICGGSLVYDQRRGGCFCLNHPEVRATKGFYVQLGRHQKRFSNDFYGAERHLNFVRSQRDYGQYDPRDWEKTKPLSLRKLSELWIAHKGNTRPPLSDGRMWELQTSVDRACALWGVGTNIKTISDEDIKSFAGYPHQRLDIPGKMLSEKSVFNICCNVKEFIEWACKIARVDPPEWPSLGYEYNETVSITMQQQMEIVEWVRKNCPEPRIIFAIQALARNANVRSGEFCEVKWGHIDLFGDKGIVYIHKRKSRRKKGRRHKLDPKRSYLESAQIEYLKTQEWGNPDEYFMVYTVGRSGVTPGTRIHPKVLNKWWRRGAESIGLNIYLYAGTKHTTTTELGKHLTREQIRRGATGHATDEAFDHYYHDQVSDQLRVQKAYDDMREKLKRVK